MHGTKRKARQDSSAARGTSQLALFACLISAALIWAAHPVLRLILAYLATTLCSGGATDDTDAWHPDMDEDRWDPDVLELSDDTEIPEDSVKRVRSAKIPKKVGT